MIHSSSVIDKKAKIGKNVKIGPFCFIGPNVHIDDEVELISNIHIEGNTKVGRKTKIFPFASIGTQPQDLKFKGEKNSLEIDLRVKKAELEKAKQDLLSNKRDLKRAKDLLVRLIIDRVNFDRIDTQYQKSIFEVNRVKALIERISDQLLKATIRSPLTGFITYKWSEVGEWVQKGGRLVEVVEVSKIIVRSPVSEKQIHTIKKDDKVYTSGKEGVFAPGVPIGTVLINDFNVEDVKLIQEIDETTTYELPKNLIGIIWKGKFRGQKQKWFVVRFTGKESEINLKTKHPEFIEWKWVEMDELPKIIVDFKKEVYEKLLVKLKKIID